MGLFFKLISTASLLTTLNTMPGIRQVNEGNNEPTLELNARSAVLMSYDSGEIIYELDPHVRLYPASMTKMMGMILILEAIDEAKLTWDEEVAVSELAKSMGGTQIYLAPGERMKVSDLFKAVAINSANDAIVALGEKVSGSLPAFIADMNQKASELKMTDTHFNNATGFDDPEHYTSAFDMALCGRELLSHGEDILKYSRLKESYIREDTTNPFWLVNTNKMLGHYLGMDGLKTGYTNLAGYNLTATASRDGVRLISVVMKEDSIKNRSSDTTKLLDYGFSKLGRVPLLPGSSDVGEFTFKKALNGTRTLYIKEEVAPIAKKGTSEGDFIAYIEMSKTSAPLSAGEEVGKLVVTNTKTNVSTTYPVYIKEEVPLYSFLDYWIANIFKFVG